MENRKLCSRCGKRAPIFDHKHCAYCREIARQRWAAKKAECPAGICKRCRTNPVEDGFRQCPSCREKQKSIMKEWRQIHPTASYQRDWNQGKRHLVIDHYGGKCACCGDKHYAFLTIDHKNGQGEKHRQEVGYGSNMIRWIINNRFPEIFRILCHNCNLARGYYGKCPHEDE